ncbi:MAG: molybdopterin-dependent oxidoreductase [Dehalococcoidia bacterium]
MAAAEWRKSACILCECNCGIEIRLGDDGRTFERIRGDKDHPASRGYTCEKPLRLDYYQNGRGERVLHPLRRRPDGSFEEIDWDTATREVAERLSAVRDAHGGESILYYGGGGQGNHLGGTYSGAMWRAFGGRYRSSAISQEKSGEIWVNGAMFGTPVRGDFEDCEVAFFVGKNPWMSHGIPRARATLRAIAKDPSRSLIVIDPRVTETAAIADFHLQVKPGRDAWLLAALVGVIVQEGLVDEEWLRAHANGVEDILRAFTAIPVAAYSEISGVDEDLVRRAARRLASAASVAAFEDLGVQMNRHSTLVSYLEKLAWALTGNLGVHGGQYAPSMMVPLLKANSAELNPESFPTSPVVGARILGGLLPCNVIPDEILTDHPKRYRALVVESGNPVHSIADSQRMRQSLEALDIVVVIDVFMTETARLADYVLPAQTQFEKHEATFFNFDFPKNVFQLRWPVVDAPAGPLPEPEIHARIVEAAGFLDGIELQPLSEAAAHGRAAFADAFESAVAAHPKLAILAPIVLYRTLGPTLPHGAAAAAALWPIARRCAAANPLGVERAGYGTGPEAGDRLFDAILTSPSGVVFTDDATDETWRRVSTPDRRVNTVMPELLDELESLRTEVPPGDDPDWPFLLSAGERRSTTANTIFRDPNWRKHDGEGALRVSPQDAERVGLVDKGLATLTSPRAFAVVRVEIDAGMSRGHIALPNGLGLDHLDRGQRVQTGVGPNEFTASAARDPWGGTPWHKSVPARLEPVEVKDGR